MNEKSILKQYVEKIFDAKKPYAFISYSHAEDDMKNVYPFLIKLMKQGINFVLDVEYNYKSGSWVPHMESRIKNSNCKCMISCYSKKYVYSRPSLIEQFYRYSLEVYINHEQNILPSLPIGMMRFDGDPGTIDGIRKRIETPVEQDLFEYILSDYEKESLEKGVEGYKDIRTDKLVGLNGKIFEKYYEAVLKQGKDVTNDELDKIRAMFVEYIIKIDPNIDNGNNYNEISAIIKMLEDDYKIIPDEDIKIQANQLLERANENPVLVKVKAVSINQEENSRVREGENSSSALPDRQLVFWQNFIEYCENNNRKEDIATANPYKANWYRISVGTSAFHIEFSIASGNIAIIIYTDTKDAFTRLESKKKQIESLFGHEFDWYSSKENSEAKRIIYKEKADIFAVEKQDKLFEWMIEKFDFLKDALISVGEIPSSVVPEMKVFTTTGDVT